MKSKAFLRSLQPEVESHEIDKAYSRFCEFERRARLLGFKNFKLYDQGYRGIAASVFKDGVKVLYKVFWPVFSETMCHIAISYLRKSNSYKKHHTRNDHDLKTLLDKTFDDVAGLKGEEKDANKVFDNDGKVAKRYWHTPSQALYKENQGYIYNTNVLVAATAKGICTIAKNGRVERKNYESPKVDAYFLVHAFDRFHRQLYFVTQDSDQFILAIPRGESIFIIDEDTLFCQTSNALRVDNINTIDMKLVRMAIDKFCNG